MRIEMLLLIISQLIINDEAHTDYLLSYSEI